MLSSEVIQDALDGREFCRRPVQLRNRVPYHGKGIRVRSRQDLGQPNAGRRLIDVQRMGRGDRQGGREPDVTTQIERPDK